MQDREHCHPECHLSFEQPHVVFKDEEAVAPLIGQLPQNPQLDEVVNECNSGIGRARFAFVI